MIKDLLKTINAVTNDKNLNAKERLLLINLVVYHNVEWGYAYPSYEDIMEILCTNKRDMARKYIKSLSDKGYIIIGKGRNNKNLYYIQKYLYFVSSKVEVQEEPKKVNIKPVDSNGKKPLENQIHVDEVVKVAEVKEDSKVIEISKYTGFNKKQSKELLKESGEDKAKVINAFDYMSKQPQDKIKDKFSYTKWEFNNIEKTINIKVQNKENNPKTRFDYFEAREYDYDNLEKKLLGWQVQEPAETEEAPSDYMTNLLKGYGK